MRKRITRLQVEAVLDGKLTIDQVVAQQHTKGDIDVDNIHRKVLNQAMERLKSENDRKDTIDKTVYDLEQL